MIIENNKPKVIKIGEWIDAYLDDESYSSAIKLYGQEDANMELLDISKHNVSAYILSCDNNGMVDWHTITNITRHDPSEYVYKITTKLGRSVTVVESKSLLIWNCNKQQFEHTDMKNVCVGSYVPLTCHAPTYKGDVNDDLSYADGYLMGAMAVEKATPLPNATYTANDFYIKGIIDGVFSQQSFDGVLKLTSLSLELLMGVAHILNRFDIVCQFEGTVDKHVIVVDDTKTWHSHNDVVFDEITSIEKVLASSDSKYKKVYDITVPDTLNFQIFNGMNVADTSDVGYLQRKLVKAMEDCKVNHDYTVRNASGSIIQFVYGEDGMDPTKIEDQPLPFVKMDYSKLKRTYLLTEDDNLQFILDDDVIENLHGTKDWQKRFETHFQEILEDREFVMKYILANEGGNKIKYPIAFARITNNAKAMFNKYDDGALSDLDPIYALNSINKMCEELYVHQHNKANKFLKMLIRCYLSPKKCIFDYKFNRLAFDYVINQIKQRFYDSIAHPSDMVGVVAAQSLGEPCTQLTLNTSNEGVEKQQGCKNVEIIAS